MSVLSNQIARTRRHRLAINRQFGTGPVNPDRMVSVDQAVQWINSLLVACGREDLKLSNVPSIEVLQNMMKLVVSSLGVGDPEAEEGVSPNGRSVPDLTPEQIDLSYQGQFSLNGRGNVRQLSVEQHRRLSQAALRKSLAIGRRLARQQNRMSNAEARNLGLRMAGAAPSNQTK